MKKYWLIVALPLVLLIWWGIGRGESSVTLHFSTARRNSIESTVSTNGKVEPAEWAAARAEENQDAEAEEADGAKDEVEDEAASTGTVTASAVAEPTEAAESADEDVKDVEEEG